MDNEKLKKYYKGTHEKKIFHTKLFSDDSSAHIMYIYEYEKEIENFCSTFLCYLPYYVRNSDQLSTISDDDTENDLINRSKKIRISKIVPQRKIEVDGLYGELFLDFYLRIVCNRKCLITYGMKKAFSVAQNEEARGHDNVVYYLDNGKINICFCEAKFVSGASTAKTKLIEDINGATNKNNGHLSKDFLNDYIAFILEQNPSIDESDKSILNPFFEKLNAELDDTNDFVNVLIKFDVCCNFIFFAIFDSTRKEPQKLIEHYNEIFNEATKKIKDLGIINYKIEIIFIPTDSKPLRIKGAIQNIYA